MQFCDVVFQKWVCQRNSIHLSSLCMRTPRADFALMAIFHPNWQRTVVFLRSFSRSLSFQFFHHDIVLSSCGISSTDICSQGKLPHVECTDDVVPLSKNPNEMQVLPDLPKGSVFMFGMLLAPSKRKLKARCRTVFLSEALRWFG